MSCQPEQPCSGWDMPARCCKTCDNDDPTLAAMWAVAVSYAYRATCFQFPGQCDVEVQPCRPCGCDLQCSCRCGSPTRTIPLADAGWCYPIVITDGVPAVEVVVDGVAQTGWRLGNDRMSLEYYGDEPWPAQNLGVDPGVDGTWSVRATIGCNPPPELLHGAARFACELYKECVGEESCLPDGVKSITRRGLTMDVGGGLEETISFDNSGTGVPEFDLALKTFGCTDFDVASYFDPLDFSPYRQGNRWEFRDILAPTPVGS